MWQECFWNFIANKRKNVEKLVKWSINMNLDIPLRHSKFSFLIKLCVLKTFDCFYKVCKAAMIKWSDSVTRFFTISLPGVCWYWASSFFSLHGIGTKSLSLVSFLQKLKNYTFIILLIRDRRKIESWIRFLNSSLYCPFELYFIWYWCSKHA